MGAYAWEQAKHPDDSPRTVGALLEPHVRPDAEFRGREEQYQQAVRESEQSGDPASLTFALHRLGLHRETTGEFTSAEDCLARAVDAGAADRGLHASLAAAANDRGVILARLARHEKAEAALDLALEHSAQPHCSQIAHAAVRNQGMLAWLAGDTIRCRQLWDNSFRSARSSDDSTANAQTLNNVGVLALLNEDSVDAAQLLNRAVLLAQRAGDLRTLSYAYNNLGLLLSGHTRGDHFKAIPFVEMALELLAGPIDIVARLYVLNNNIHVYENAHLEPARTFRAQFDATLRSFRSSYPRRSDDAERVPYALHPPDGEDSPDTPDNWELSPAPVLLRTFSRCAPDRWLLRQGR